MNRQSPENIVRAFADAARRGDVDAACAILGDCEPSAADRLVRRTLRPTLATRVRLATGLNLIELALVLAALGNTGLALWLYWPWRGVLTF